MDNSLAHLTLKKYRASLKPLTPTIVLGGTEGVVGIDVLIRQKDVCVVDMENLPSQVLLEIAKTGEHKILEIFMKHREALPCKLTSMNNIEELDTGKRVKLPQEHVVPGSTLKGYIRTALMYYMLTSDHTKHELFSKIKKTIDSLKEKKLIDASTLLEQYFFKRKRLEKQGGEADMLQNLHVSDPLAKESLSYSLEWLTVYNLFKRRRVARLPGVVLVGGNLRYEINIVEARPSFEAPEESGKYLSGIINKLNELASIDLTAALRTFGCDLVDHELSLINDINELRGYKRVLQSFKEKYCGASQQNCVISRIGFMTGHMAKTIDLYIKKRYPQMYEELKKSMSKKLHRKWNDSTIKLVGPQNNLLGLGWCELCVEKSH
ncbi:MAG: type III-A CRISPR-associated RAMP protein Csm5 [Fervidicoccaceae archaeon]|nr:type III-A CRISPR-associated RAMP protein Csm5 [Fervidicoccaceae archaeon]